MTLYGHMTWNFTSSNSDRGEQSFRSTSCASCQFPRAVRTSRPAETENRLHLFLGSFACAAATMAEPCRRAAYSALQSVFTHTSKQTCQSQRVQFQHHITSNPAKTLIASRYYPRIQPALAPFSQVRHASHNAQGTANAHSESRPGRRLGAKKTGDQYVIPGNIIFRQRGSKWWAGENCAMGRDHTIYATERGYVKFYKDPQRHPDRRYIGVAFEKSDQLPSPRNAPTKRRLGLIAVPRQVETETEAGSVEISDSGSSMKVKLVPSDSSAMTTPPRPGYMYRESNWEIGRAADRAGITVKKWRRKDRWTAWKKRLEKTKRIAQMKELKKRRKTQKSKKVSKK